VSKLDPKLIAQAILKASAPPEPDPLDAILKAQEEDDFPAYLDEEDTPPQGPDIGKIVQSIRLKGLAPKE